MRKLAIGIIAAGTLMVGAPAMSQIVFDGPGVDVRIGGDRPYYRDHYRDHYYDYGWDRSAWRGSCKTVTVRERAPDGRVVVRTRERC